MVNVLIMTAQIAKSSRSSDFFAAHPVFTHEDFVGAHSSNGRSPHTSNSILRYQVKAGRLVRIKRGIYATVPFGVQPSEFQPDPALVATHLRSDAVVAYHSALAFHGRAHSTWWYTQYMSAARVRSFVFRAVDFVGIQAPKVVRELDDFGGGVQTRPHAGGQVRVMSLERTLVDLLHSPEHGGGWEEIWRSLESVEYFDLERVVEFTLRMDSALTTARVGFILEQHRELWMVDAKHLNTLEAHALRQPSYLDRRRERGKLVHRWNLIVPERVLHRQWEEPL
jgi:predicted transcriptional regulator of viral defense system